ncbi:FAD-binding deoxyribodipyrimidine photolyase [Phlyctochytrium arcticum]|nr:FAD-binding deoxyribodipyrimidine photolyase [Phlyctochytrium arcticum]
MAPAKADFLLRNLTSLRASLAALSIPLMVHTANSIPSIPHLLRDICGTCHVKHVFWNVEFEVDEQRRDKATRQVLTESGIAVDEFIDQTVLEPGTIRSKEGKVYTVYSPFMRSWIATITKTPAFLNVTPTPVAPARDPVFSPEVTNYLAEHSDIPTTLPPLLPLNPQLAAVVNRDFPAGEEAAHTRVHEFFKYHVEKYGVLRDYPANPLHTSRISAYLSSGILSTRQLFSLIYKTSPAAFTSTKGKTPSGLTKWVSEVIWREFYRDVLVGYPRVSKNLPFKPEMIHLQWAQDEGDVMFTKWCEGQTGYPIVDAGMRQLVQTGYIPNRIRMIVASFLSKHLLIDWRRGERFFMQNLIDGDLANNNGGWQWAASTGVDPQPYFRIFNPYLQSQKFDQDGTYIRKWVPELEGVASQFIHEPHRLLSKKVFGGLGYPEPVVDHKLARERALKVYKAASGK